MPTSGPAGPRIELLKPAADGRVAALLAAAFRDNPLNRAVIRSDDPERRLRCNLHGMQMLLPSARRSGRVSAAWVGAELVGALIAAPPFAYPLPPPPMGVRIRGLLGQGPRVTGRWGSVFRALDALHLREPHWYLGTLGVDPPSQASGVGSALLAEWVVQVDRDAVSAYLETDRLENVSFYQRAGFEVSREARVLEVPVWCMERPARAPTVGGAAVRPTH